MHDPGQLDLPVDLLAALLAEPDIPRAAARAHPLGLGHVVDLLAARQMGVVPAAVPTPAPPLPTATLVRPASRIIAAPSPVAPSPPDAGLAAFSDDVPNASLASTDTFSASAPT